MPHPVQPLQKDAQGIVRFKRNAIVCDLLVFASKRGMDLNRIACGGYSDEDREQLAQLIGYSLCGFGDLSYVSDETFARAEAQPVQE